MTRYESVAVSPGTAGMERAVRRAVEVLQVGGVIAHTTETVYGIGGAVLSEVDLQVATLKARALDAAPLIRIAADTETLEAAFPELLWPVEARRLALGFWPGALTLVLEDGSGRGTAVRVEGHPVTRSVLRAWGAPIGSTSLNLAGEPAALTSRQSRECLGRMPDVEAPVVFLDAGTLPGPPPSTLVSFLGTVPEVLREGAIPAAAIQNCLKGADS